jgi:hypothetical protein
LRDCVGDVKEEDGGGDYGVEGGCGGEVEEAVDAGEDVGGDGGV